MASWSMQISKSYNRNKVSQTNWCLTKPCLTSYSENITPQIQKVFGFNYLTRWAPWSHFCLLLYLEIILQFQILKWIMKLKYNYVLSINIYSLLLYSIFKLLGKGRVEFFVGDNVIIIPVNLCHYFDDYFCTLVFLTVVWRNSRQGLEDANFLFAKYLLQLVFIDCTIFVNIEHVEHFSYSSLIQVWLSTNGSL